MNLKKIIGFLAIVLVLNVGSAFAVDLTVTNIIGNWTNANAGSGATLVDAAAQGTDTARWGTDAGSGQSGYNFTPAGNKTIGTGTPGTLGVPFLLGTFQHLNNPITSPFLTTIDYNLSFTTNGIAASLGTLIHFSHNETPNNTPCAAGPDGPSVTVCDDFVTVSESFPDQNVNVGGTLYFFNLLGFSKNGGVTINNTFQSAEGSTNSAGLYAIVTLTPINTPEPDALLLLGTGLGGVALIARKLKKS